MPRWSALVQQAQSRVDRCRVESSAARANAAALAANRVRVDAMVADYQAQLAQARRQGHTMREDANARRFLEQLATLQARIGVEQQHAGQRCAAAVDAEALAAARLQKFQHLAEREDQAAHALHIRQEQKRDDEWALISHQWSER
jgi:flagellar biosynthesis chaperone FliJ